MDQNKIWVPQGSILDPLLFLVYINHLPKAIEHKAIPILFADNTSILITSPNNIKFQSDVNKVFGQLNKWFKSICFPGSFTKLISFNLLIKVCVLLTYRLRMKINRFVQLLK